MNERLDLIGPLRIIDTGKHIGHQRPRFHGVRLRDKTAKVVQLHTLGYLSQIRRRLRRNRQDFLQRSMACATFQFMQKEFPSQVSSEWIWTRGFTLFLNGQQRPLQHRNLGSRP